MTEYKYSNGFCHEDVSELLHNPKSADNEDYLRTITILNAQVFIRNISLFNCLQVFYILL